MKVSFEITLETLPVGGNSVIDIDMAQLDSADVQAYIFRHGLKQMLGDAYSTTKGSHELKFAAAQKKLASLYAGKVAQERGASDPIGKLVREMALDDVKAKVKAAGKKFADLKKETVANAVKAMIEKHGETYRKQAEKIVALKPVKVVDDIDIEDLLGE